MTENPKTISLNASLIDAARLMLQHKISALPVLDGDRVGWHHHRERYFPRVCGI